MGETTIEWTARRLPSGERVPGYTFNLVWGCQKISEGCRDCYADAFARRLGLDLWGPGTERRTFGVSYWRRPLQWNEAARRAGHPRAVFCSSMADVFEDHPVVEQERRTLWPLIEATPWLTWLLLTKRPHRVLSSVPWGTSFPENVWVGTSVETQTRARERVPALLAVPARVRFLSCEPLLGPLDLSAWLPALQWVIVGGESGARARPLSPLWALDLRDQCQSAAVPFFFKQWGGRTHAAGGRLLEGMTYDALPVEVVP